MKWLSGKEAKNKIIHARDIQPGDFVDGKEVQEVEMDLGMVVVYFKSGGYALFNRSKEVEAVRCLN